MRNSVGKVASTLAAKIESGEWEDGYRLPPERTLAAEHGMARNTLRQALDELEKRRLIVRQVGRGTFVRAEGRSEPAAGILARMRNASPADLMEVRQIVEPQVAHLAATRANAQDLGAIETALRQSLLAKGTAEFEHWDAALHLAIARASRNALLADYCEAIGVVRNQARWHHLKQKTTTPELRHLYDRHHSALVTALRERDADAARRAMIEHLAVIRDNLIGAAG
jgi:DNA-binding FadR family transcriptional regulator